MKTIVVIFSYNRALQLDALLNSFLFHCGDSQNADVKILYTADKTHIRQYDELKNEYKSYSNIQFVKENNFKEDLLGIIKNYEHSMFLVDDNIFIGGFEIDLLTRILDRQNDALGFSLRLGSNTNYCYPHKSSQKIPVFTEVNHEFYKWNWTLAEHDFAYPLELSSSIYRTKDIYSLMEALPFKKPNSLEAGLAEKAVLFAHSKMNLLSYKKSVAFCAPANIVQSEIINNRKYSGSLFSPENMAVLFSNGFRINTAKFNSLTTTGAHQEVEFGFIEKKTGVEFNYVELAEHFIKTENLVLAEQFLEHVISANPRNIFALNDLGVLNIMKKNIPTARVYLSEVLKIDPYNEIAKENLDYISANYPDVNNGKPGVCIYMVTYNCEKYIGKAIKSVLAQTYKNFELIIVNDGSTDNTLQVINSFKDNRIKVFTKEHKNFASGLNFAIRHCTADYLAGVDSDDYISADYIKNMMEYIQQNPGFDYYYPESFTIVDANDTQTGELSEFSDYSDNKIDIIRKMFQNASGPIPNPGSFRRRDLYERTEMYQELDTIEDFVFISRNFMEINFKMAEGKNGYFYRILPKSNSRKFVIRNKIMADALKHILHKYPAHYFNMNFKKKDENFWKYVFSVLQKHAEKYNGQGGEYFINIIKEITN